jgi:hypothetical protein
MLNRPAATTIGSSPEVVWVGEGDAGRDEVLLLRPERSSGAGVRGLLGDQVLVTPSLLDLTYNFQGPNGNNGNVRSITDTRPATAGDPQKDASQPASVGLLLRDRY